MMKRIGEIVDERIGLKGGADGRKKRGGLVRGQPGGRKGLEGRKKMIPKIEIEIVAAMNSRMRMTRVNASLRGSHCRMAS